MIVGASGTILTQQMAIAMNRSITLGDRRRLRRRRSPAIAGGGGATGGTVRSTSAADVAIQMAYARQVVVVPGYGMAVAQAQHAVREMAKLLEEKGVEVKYAIHPVAGRMPGHMNVLLAEADVPYEQLKEMDDINGGVPAHRRVARHRRQRRHQPRRAHEGRLADLRDADPQRRRVAVDHRPQALDGSGFAGIDNPLFFNPKTSMLFGDAKASVADITAELGAL